MMRALLAVGALALVVAACGSEDTGGVVETPGATGTTGTGGEPAPATELSVTVSAGGEVLRQATLSCAGGEATGTGHLAEPAAARAACDLLADDSPAARRLVDGRPEGLMCTQVFGGPEEAEVVGSIGGSPVNARIDRTDGCGIADWDLLEPLLGPPGV